MWMAQRRLSLVSTKKGKEVSTLMFQVTFMKIECQNMGEIIT